MLINIDFQMKEHFCLVDKHLILDVRFNMEGRDESLHALKGYVITFQNLMHCMIA